MKGVSSPPRFFGVWETKVNLTVYQAPSDGMVVGTIAVAPADSRGFSDGDNPPTTKRGEGFGGTGINATLNMPVRKGDYWKTDNCVIVYWLSNGA